MAGRANYPARAAIDAYGDGGFRFAGMSHKGSILVLSSGVYGWNVTSADALRLQSIAQVLDDAPPTELLILGTGIARIDVPRSIAEALSQAGIGIEIMDTGAAARTFNILLAEERDVAAALIAVGAG